MSHNSHDFDEIQLYIHYNGKCHDSVYLVRRFYLAPSHTQPPPPFPPKILNLLHSLRKFTEKDFASKTNEVIL